VVFAHSGSAQFSYLEDQVLCLGTRRNNIFGSGVDATGLRSLALGDLVTLLARVDVGLRRDCHPKRSDSGGTHARGRFCEHGRPFEWRHDAETHKRMGAAPPFRASPQMPQGEDNYFVPTSGDFSTSWLLLICTSPTSPALPVESPRPYHRAVWKFHISLQNVSLSLGGLQPKLRHSYFTSLCCRA
jgi:hypothetical protein